MDQLIQDTMQVVFSAFQNTIDGMESLCTLKALRFDANQTPDYITEAIQQYYLLRYFPAYLAEYYLMYSRMLESWLPSDALNILSIGSGCGVDFCSLALLLWDRSIDTRIRYTGIDRVPWAFKTVSQLHTCETRLEDVGGWRALDREDYTVLVFPKSVGEFSEKTFDNLLRCFGNTPFAGSKLWLLSSNRVSYRERDGRRTRLLARILEDVHGYACRGIKDSSDLPPNVGIRKVLHKFVYPDHIKDFLKALLNRCLVFRVTGEPCEHACSDLNRYPILTTNHMAYEVWSFSR